MSFAAVLAAMPDLLARALAEHVPDDGGRCRECRTDDGSAAPWPCAMRLIAEEANGVRSGHQEPHPRPVDVGDGPVTAPQPPVSDGWDPIADRRAFRRDRYTY